MSRGWSLVFEDRTDENARDTDEHPQADLDPMTVIDRDMSEEIQAALNAHKKKLEAPTTQPEAEVLELDLEPTELPLDEADELIRNVPIAAEPDVHADNAPEHTVRAPAPVFDEAVLPDATIEGPPPFEVLDAAGPRFVDDDEDDEDTTSAFREEAADPAVHSERTRKAPIPFDLFQEQPLPRRSSDAKVERAKLAVGGRRVARERNRAQREPEVEIPKAPDQSGTETMLDLAAQLGIPPGAKDPAEQPRGGEPAVVHKETVELPASPNDEIDLLPLLGVEEGGRKKKKDKKGVAVPIIRQANRPSEGMAAEDIARLAGNADTAARTIPLVLAIFVVIATITAIVMLFSSKERTQEHLELRFLSLKGPMHKAVRPSDTPTRIAIDTIPEGIFVLYGREILGKTPILVDLPIQLDERTGVELSSPYFERWVGEVVQDPSGEYRVSVELKKK